MLNSLVIKNFRLLEDFTVEKLGRVNLIVGKNNSGKSTVLEALRIYAGNANLALLNEIAISHDEKYLQENVKFEELDISKPFEDLFTGRRIPNDETEIIIGESIDISNKLCISHGLSVNEPVTDRNGEPITDRNGGKVYTIAIHSNAKSFNYTEIEDELLLVKRNEKFHHSISLKKNNSPFILEKISINYGFIPTQFISTEELAKEWDKIVFTEYEEIVKQALKIILPDFENIAFVGEQSKRVAKIKIANSPRPVSLKSLGDGMIRVLQLALKLVSAKDGFLLIDEFENGLHYSTQEKIWALLFEMAERLNIQVFATTHSWDCIEAFTKVALENETTEGVLFRMGRSARKSNYGKIIATVFDKEKLARMTQADIEIR